jgi:hypothetical protein
MTKTWRLMLVCKVARVGAKDFLNTLPRGLTTAGGFVNGIWRLDLAMLRWEVIHAPS